MPADAKTQSPTGFPITYVVLVEGKSDFYLLRYMAEVLGVNSTAELFLVPVQVQWTV